MTAYEVLKLNVELLNRLTRYGIKLEDCKYMNVFEDYALHEQQGTKQSSVVAQLAEKYSLSERTIYRVIQRYRTLCQPLSVE